MKTEISAVKYQDFTNWNIQISLKYCNRVQIELCAINQARVPCSDRINELLICLRTQN